METINDRTAQTINRTPAPGCPACEAKRLHTPEDWKHHPLAGSTGPAARLCPDGNHVLDDSGVCANCAFGEHTYAVK